MDQQHYRPLQQAWRRLARPLVVLLLKNGVMYQEFAKWCKQAYVTVAEEDFGKRGRPTNQSRIALLTGLDRKEIKRLRDARNAASPSTRAGAKADRLGRVLGAWYQDERFFDTLGPRPLRIDGGFAQLCRDYGGDVPDSTILKELESGGAVERCGKGRVLAKRRYYMPAPTNRAALARSAEVYRDLGETLVYNLYRAPDQPSRFEGRVSGLRVAKRHAPAFKEFIERRGQAFLEEVDQWLHDKESDTDDNEDTMRLGVGLYHLQEENPSDA